MCEVKRGHIDRIVEGKHAVLIINGIQEVVLKVEDLPEGVTAGSLVTVAGEGATLEITAVSVEEQEREEEKVRDLRESVKKSSRGSRFKRRT